jgi:hypothetical protein
MQDTAAETQSSEVKVLPTVPEVLVAPALFAAVWAVSSGQYSLG